MSGTNIISGFQITNNLNITDGNLVLQTNGSNVNGPSLDLTGTMLIGDVNETTSNNSKLKVSNQDLATIELISKQQPSNTTSTTTSLKNDQGIFKFNVENSTRNVKYIFDVSDNLGVGMISNIEGGDERIGFVLGTTEVININNGIGSNGKINMENYDNPHLFYNYHNLPENRFLGFAGTNIQFLTANETDLSLNELNPRMIINTSGNIGINTLNPGVSLNVNDNDGIKLPNGTTAQRPTTSSTNLSDISGIIRFNTDLQKCEVYQNTWVPLGRTTSLDGTTRIESTNTEGIELKINDITRMKLHDSSSRIDLSGNVVVQNANNNGIIFTVDGSSNFVGNVGIGTNSPLTRLHIGNLDDFQAGIMTTDNLWDSNALTIIHQTPTTATILNDPKPVLYLGRDGTASQAYGALATFCISRWEHAGTSYVGARTRMDIKLDHDKTGENTPTVMTMRSDGRIGIGTTDIRLGTIHLKTKLGQNDGFYIENPNADSNGGNFLFNSYLYGSTTAGLVIQEYDDTHTFIANRFMIEKQTGNIGINTNNPGHLLDVVGGNIVCDQKAWIKSSLTIGHDGVLTISSTNSALHNYGAETVTLQTAIDGRNPISGNESHHDTESRHILSLQPIKGRVGIGFGTTGGYGGYNPPDEKFSIYQGNICLEEVNGYASQYDKYIYTKFEDSSNKHQIGFEFDYYAGSGVSSVHREHTALSVVSNSYVGQNINGSGMAYTFSFFSSGDLYWDWGKTLYCGGASGLNSNNPVPGSSSWQGKLIQTGWTNTIGDWVKFFVPGGGNSVDPVLTILDNNCVGINNYNPGHALDVNGNIRVGVGGGGENAIFFKGTTGDATDSECVIENRIYNSSYEASELLLFKGNDIVGSSGPDRIRLRASEIVLDTYSSATTARDTESIRLKINQNGSVGIGTISPAAKLDVNGNIACGKINLAYNNEINCTYSGGNTLYLNYSSGNVNLANHGGETYCGGNISLNGCNIRGSGWMYWSSHGNRGWYMQDSTWIRTLYNASIYAGSGNIATTGRIGIGTSGPGYPLEVIGQVGSPNVKFAYYALGSTVNYGVITWGSADVSIKCTNRVMASEFAATSDKRIKENIVEVPDNLSLQTLRDISCCYYNYRDRITKGNEKTIGFIAQQVREHMPIAVSLVKEIIPNEIRIIENPVWTSITDGSGNNKFKLTITDLEDVSGNTKYKFYMSNTESNEDEKMIHCYSLENEPNSFIFDKKYNYVYLYGKEVDDFHFLQKSMLFALNFSATQEIDRIQQQEKTKLNQANAKIADLENKNNVLTSKIADLENQMYEIKQLLAAANN